ncbi:hypothetical protein DENSPDRAFT_843157 [Dentipellis sp. KUC8613]|nr:hypothetical protein DENSPDRAFT_843157 [Dentipellis sp. KUC8613]
MPTGGHSSGQHSQQLQTYAPHGTGHDGNQYSQQQFSEYGTPRGTHNSSGYVPPNVPAHSGQSTSYQAANAPQQATVPTPHHHSSSHASHGSHTSHSSHGSHGSHAGYGSYGAHPPPGAHSGVASYAHPPPPAQGYASAPAQQHDEWGTPALQANQAAYSSGSRSARITGVPVAPATRGSLSPHSPSEPQWSTSLPPSGYGAPTGPGHSSVGAGVPLVSYSRPTPPVQCPPPDARGTNGGRRHEDSYNHSAPPMARHNSSHSSSASSSAAAPQIRCRMRGCQRPAYVDRSTGEQKEWCGDGHQLEAVASRMVPPCVECRAYPQRLNSQYCSIVCESKAYSYSQPRY